MKAPPDLCEAILPVGIRKDKAFVARRWQTTWRRLPDDGNPLENQLCHAVGRQ